MRKYVIDGRRPLYGDVTISGMKNAALPIIFATILTGSRCVLRNIPFVNDIMVSLDILKSMGAKVTMLAKNVVEIDTQHFEPGTSPVELVGKVRGSTYLLGAELGRYSSTRVTWPGGCDFGTRPIDQHIKGFRALGAEVETESGFIVAEAKNGLKGDSLYFDVASVGATVNVILASIMAEGTTIIDNAAREPHIVDLANFLNTCGADISGAGTSMIKVRGVKSLHGCDYTIIPDMIEAGTYMAAVAAAGGCVTVHSVITRHIETISAKLREMGVSVEEISSGVIVSSNRVYQSTNIKTLPYPGFATDMHPQFAAMLSLANGVSNITETIWESRFRYVDELSKMGASITVDGRHATIIGKGHLSGAPVTALDLRAGAALVIAGLAAVGTTEIMNAENTIERGYEDIVGKLQGIGADIRCQNEPEPDYLLRAN